MFPHGSPFFFFAFVESYNLPDFPIAREFNAVLELCPFVVILPIFPTISGELVMQV